MSKTAFYIHFDGEWKAFEGPEELELPCNLTQQDQCEDKSQFRQHRHVCKCRAIEIDREQALSEAAKNSLKILNPEVITTDEVPGEPGKPYEPDNYYQWPGTYLVDKCWAPTGWVLTPPAALEEESHDDLWIEFGNRVNSFYLQDGDTFGIHPILDILKNEFHLTRKQQTK
jgi:hypothetical protein